jgi:hypothetical protein
MVSGRRSTTMESRFLQEAAMSETMHELIPVLFMFGCVLALGPLVGVTLWMIHDGDRLRERSGDEG